MAQSNIYKRYRQGGFTLIELVVGMLIAGIILLAVATLSFAIGRGQEVTDLMIENQSMMRSLSIRMPELVRNSLAVWMDADGDLAIWTADADNNRQIEASELTYLIANTAGSRIEVMTCAGFSTAFTIAEIQNGSAKAAIKSSVFKQIVPVVKDCTNMQFFMQGYKYVILRFQLPEENGSRDYQVCARARGDATAWIQGGALVGTDDD